MNRVHELKIRSKYFNAVVRGEKTFEIRKNDRGFCTGDDLLLKEFAFGYFTGAEIRVTVTYICDYAQKDDHVVLAIKPV